MIYYRDKQYGDEVYSSNKPYRGIGKTPEQSLQDYLNDIRKYDKPKPILKEIIFNGKTRKNSNGNSNTGGDLDGDLETTYCRPSYAFSCSKRKHIQQ